MQIADSTDRTEALAAVLRPIPGVEGLLVDEAARRLHSSDLLLEGIKRAVDHRGLINPGALRLD